jgi:hypothetical protein
MLSSEPDAAAPRHTLDSLKARDSTRPSYGENRDEYTPFFSTRYWQMDDLTVRESSSYQRGAFQHLSPHDADT